MLSAHSVSCKLFFHEFSDQARVLSILAFLGTVVSHRPVAQYDLLQSSTAIEHSSATVTDKMTEDHPRSNMKSVVLEGASTSVAQKSDTRRTDPNATTIDVRDLYADMDIPFEFNRHDPDVDEKIAAMAYQCCGEQRAYDYIQNSTIGSRFDAFLKLWHGSAEERESLLSLYVKYPDGYCKNDYDCNFETEIEGVPISCYIEHYTIDQYNKWIPVGARVLEVGARYGQASCYLSQIVGSTGSLVAVDADRDVWPVWEKNVDAHKCNATLVKGVVGTRDLRIAKKKGYGTRAGNASGSGTIVTAYTYESLAVDFDTLGIDCEGCFAAFLADNPGLEDKLKLIVAEIHDDGEEAEVARLKAAGWLELDPSVDRMTILSRSVIEPSNHPCVDRI